MNLDLSQRPIRAKDHLAPTIKPVRRPVAFHAHLASPGSCRATGRGRAPARSGLPRLQHCPGPFARLPGACLRQRVRVSGGDRVLRSQRLAGRGQSAQPPRHR